jgi:hypothetical protein
MRRWLTFALATLVGCGDGITLVFPTTTSALRPDNDFSSDMFRFDSTDVVVSLDSPGGEFRVHYTEAGANAVPSADEDLSSVPDFVEDTALAYDAVLLHYESLGFRPPLTDTAVSDNGGDERFDVYLIDFAGSADGAFRLDGCATLNPDRCVGYMVQENDFAGYGYPSLDVAVRTLASHEFFHAVQAAYDADQGSVFAEGTAVWATESFDPTLDDLEWFSDGYMSNTDRSLDKPLPGPVDPFSYGSAVFFQFLAERFAPAVILELWEATESGTGGELDPYWFDALPTVLLAHDSSFEAAFVEFAWWNLFTGSRADAGVAYANAAQLDRPTIETVSPPYQDAELRLYYASTTYYSASASDYTAMGAVLADADPADLEGLALVLVVERGTAYDDAVLVTAPTEITMLDTAGATRLVVGVVNTLRAGNSRQPGICIGDESELEACRAELAPPPRESTTSDPESGCAAAPGSMALLLPLAVLRRRLSPRS